MTDADIGQLQETQDWYTAAGHDTEYTDPRSDRDEPDDDDFDCCSCTTWTGGAGPLGSPYTFTDITGCPVHDVEDPKNLDEVWEALERR
jgi:hypothetical protein